MGIPGLCDHINQSDVTLHELRGKSFAIDGHCLLHKAAFGCAEKLVLHNEFQSVAKSVANTVSDFLKVASHVILVFDGGYLPSKQETNDKRHKAREEAKQTAIKLKNQHHPDFFKYVQQAIHFDKDMVIKIAESVYMQLTNNMQNQDVIQKFFVIFSPYEADAQLIYLQNNLNLADVIVTIDSDLLIYGPKAVLLKYNTNEKQGVLVEKEDILSKTFTNLNSFYTLRKMCVLSGCDYVKSAKGIGLLTAYKEIQQQQTLAENIHKFVVQQQKQHYYENPDQYYQLSLQALFTFQYHYVFDPVQQQCVNLNQKQKQDEILFELFGQCLGQQYNKNQILEVCCPLQFQKEQLKHLNKLCKNNSSLINEQQISIVQEEQLEVLELSQGIIKTNQQHLFNIYSDQRNTPCSNSKSMFKSILDSVKRQ